MLAVRKFAREKPKEEQEELAQECYLALLKAESRIEQADNPASFAYTVVHNHLIDLYRRDKPQRSTFSLHAPELVREVGDIGESEEIVQNLDVKRAIAELEGEEQFIIEAIFFHGRTERELAQTLHCPRSRIHTKKEQALKKMKGILNGC